VIAGAIDIPGEAIIDGEVVVTHEGRTNFSELQAELQDGRQPGPRQYPQRGIEPQPPTHPTR
jgi:ATP-dependent DNA ligase